MAIISFTNYKRGQTTGCMSAVMRYTMQDKKTEFEGQQLVTGINCQPESVYADFMTTKRLYHKTDGVLFYHMVQSFPKGEAVDPVTAHAAALKLDEYYEGYEVLVCTHTDREHIHSHFLINSVNFDTGRKLHIAKEQLQELRQRNDMVCKEFSLPVFQPREQKQKTKTMTIGEYHTASRGQSKKLQLMNIINDCMRHASNREEFIALMESEGYKVRWEKSRKNITYTMQSVLIGFEYPVMDTLLFYVENGEKLELSMLIRSRRHSSLTLCSVSRSMYCFVMPQSRPIRSRLLISTTSTFPARTASITSCRAGRSRVIPEPCSAAAPTMVYPACSA